MLPGSGSGFTALNFFKSLKDEAYLFTQVVEYIVWTLSDVESMKVEDKYEGPRLESGKITLKFMQVSFLIGY